MKWWWGAACLLALAGPAGLVRGQYISFDVERQEGSLPASHPSVRLEGMSGLALTIPDENNELNLSDFGQNLAGTASDRRGWSAETWFGRSNRIADANTSWRGSPVRQRHRLNQQIFGLDVVYRKAGRRAIGTTTSWNAYDAQNRYGTDSRVSGPAPLFFYNEVIGRFSLAAGLSLPSDNEDVVSTDLFALRHTSSSRMTTFAGAYDLKRFLAAIQVQFDRVRISGGSIDPAGFHDDAYDWRRPDTRIRLSLIRPESGHALSYGLNWSAIKREGAEEVLVSWADRFPANPGRVNYTVRLPVFTEKEDGWEAEGRAAWKSGSKLRFGAYGMYGSFHSVVDEAPNSNFVGSRTAQDVKTKAWRLGGGVGTTLSSGRLRLGGEGYVGGGQTQSVELRSNEKADNRQFDLRAGGEWLLPADWAVRAGYRRRSADANLDAPADLLVANGLSVGFGYLPDGGLVTMDVAMKLWTEDPDNPGQVKRKVRADDLVAAIRVLF